MPPEKSCKRIERDLTAFHQGELAPEKRARIQGHLESCEACATRLESVRGVFQMAGTIEDLVPSMRFKRNMAGLLKKAGRPELDLPEAGILWRAQTALAFLLHRVRTSGRFRLAAVSVGVHVVLLAVLSLVVIPGIAEDRKLPVVVWNPDPGFGSGGGSPDGDAVGDPVVARGDPEHLPVAPNSVPFTPWLGPDMDPGSGWPPVPPADRVERWRLTALLSSTIDARAKQRKLAACLGDPKAALGSISRALDRLAERQEEDGSWAASASNPAYREGVTAFVLLAFLSDGHGETRGRKAFRPVVAKGIDRLLAVQVGEGELAGLIGPANGHYMYNHALATLALVEAYCLDYRPARRARSGELSRAIRAAVDLIQKSQTPEGGWRYEARLGPPFQNDTSVSIFQVMALAAARHARFPVKEEAFTAFSKWLRSVTDEKGVVRYQSGDVVRNDAPRTLTAGALYLEELLGLASPLRDRQAAAVLAELEDDEGSAPRNGLLRFFSTLAFRMRGEIVLDRFAPGLIETQRPDGSWSASSTADDLWAIHAGSDFLTALNVLTLTSSYRFAL